MLDSLDNMCIVRINGTLVGFPMLSDGTIFEGERLELSNTDLIITDNEICIGHIDVLDKRFYPSFKYVTKLGTVNDYVETNTFATLLKAVTESHVIAPKVT
jgi:hypothetical protein